ncbi:hypothetical protein L249_6634 [Ophiocordyceps polyrhachis-furcata BCC 54312]|uniref:Uncharacterized protein n=1 Tax=Ophiocordyceps polyrhachis-furcata BCC 54312 TaxID=1330021 RepID=A0A367LL06_9HYPO|nr:hypothetical protein L249_6634 [Ophiocordyceps polyrhachis-furcata BCC 54312]
MEDDDNDDDTRFPQLTAQDMSSYSRKTLSKSQKPMRMPPGLPLQAPLSALGTRRLHQRCLSPFSSTHVPIVVILYCFILPVTDISCKGKMEARQPPFPQRNRMHRLPPERSSPYFGEHDRSASTTY